MSNKVKRNYKQEIIEYLEKANDTKLERLWCSVKVYLS